MCVCVYVCGTEAHESVRSCRPAELMCVCVSASECVCMSACVCVHVCVSDSEGVWLNILLSAQVVCITKFPKRSCITWYCPAVWPYLLLRCCHTNILGSLPGAVGIVLPGMPQVCLLSSPLW